MEGIYAASIHQQVNGMQRSGKGRNLSARWLQMNIRGTESNNSSPVRAEPCHREVVLFP